MLKLLFYHFLHKLIFLHVFAEADNLFLSEMLEFASDQRIRTNGLTRTSIPIRKEDFGEFW